MGLMVLRRTDWAMELESASERESPLRPADAGEWGALASGGFDGERRPAVVLASNRVQEAAIVTDVNDPAEGTISAGSRNTARGKHVDSRACCARFA